MSTSLDGLKTALADRYALEGEIGAGGMATVYLAEDLKHHRSVAVKVLRPELAASLGPERFVREIAIAASLTHPHILMLFDSGEAAGFLYYVMPYVDGESLRDRLDREGRLSVSHTVRIADQVASALHYAHERGVVHRDIKPENILLAGDQAVVADFGIARAVAVAGAERLTRTGLAIGTPQYMSPEQALGESDIDGRSDVYSLACIVYEMVAGRQLFEGSSPQALVAKHVASTAPGLRTIDPELPLFVDRAVARALAKEPAGRFETAAAFAEALTTETVVAPVGRRRLAVLPPVNLTNDPEQAHLVMGLHEALISQLGHGHVAVLARSSVLQYQGTEKPAREIARELGVQSIIESSLFRANDTIGVQARLIDGETEEGLWSGSYDGDVGNLFGLYRDLAGSIAKEIQVVLAPPESRPSHETRTIDPAAYEAYMRGRMHQERFSPAEFDVAMEYYQTAIAIDPNYAAAYSGIALIWGSRIVLGLVPPHEGGPEWKKAALKAVALDPTLAEARQALAQAYTWYDWDWPAAETEFLQAIALGPKEPQTRTFYAHFLSMMMRREEASAQMQKALDIDPYNPFTNLLAGALMLQGGQ